MRARMLEAPEKKEVKAVPTLASFVGEFFSSYVDTHNKPSEKRMKRSTLKFHLLPAFGRVRLDAIGVRDIERYKATKLKAGLSKKTVNNHLTILRKMLSVASDWEILKTLPRFTWFRVDKPEFDFLDFDEAERLIAASVVSRVREGGAPPDRMARAPAYICKPSCNAGRAAQGRAGAARALDDGDDDALRAPFAGCPAGCGGEAGRTDSAAAWHICGTGGGG